MPLPKPTKNEDRQDFVSRCIADLTKNEKDRWPNPKQRDAICYKQSGETKQQRERAENKPENKKKS